MSTHSKLKLENQICHSLYSATNALVRAYRPLLEHLDLTYPQYLVMLALWEEDGVIIKTLVAKTRFDAGTLTPILKRLEQKQIIERRLSTEDSRQKFLVVTELGRQLAKKAESVPDALMCQVKMTVAEAIELKRLSEILFHQLVD